ncbi:MAG: MarR family winged helix-turn-helix transcriptional regulator [Acidimicrobiales bacterium]
MVTHTTKQNEATFSELESGVGFRLNRVARALRRSWALELEPLNLTPPQAVLLRALSEEPRCSIRCLSRRIGQDAMSTKRATDCLESRGLLRSAHRGTDRRPRQLELTDEGNRVAALVRTKARHREEALRAALAHEHLDALSAALTSLESHLQIGCSSSSEETTTTQNLSQ